MYVTKQTASPVKVGTLRGVVAGVVFAVLTGFLDALRSHQVGYSWGDSIESGLLIAVPLLIAIAASFTGYAVYDQAARARKEG